MDRETAEEIKRHFEVTTEGLRSEMHALAGGLQGEIRAVGEKVDRSSADLKRHFEVVGGSLRSDIRTVAEGFVSTNERLDRFESAMSKKFGELEVMIRLSFGELAQRIH
jgi:hypothetical protein